MIWHAPNNRAIYGSIINRLLLGCRRDLDCRYHWEGFRQYVNFSTWRRFRRCIDMCAPASWLEECSPTLPHSKNRKHHWKMKDWRYKIEKKLTEVRRIFRLIYSAKNPMLLQIISTGKWLPETNFSSKTFKENMHSWLRSTSLTMLIDHSLGRLGSIRRDWMECRYVGSKARKLNDVEDKLDLKDFPGFTCFAGITVWKFEIVTVSNKDKFFLRGSDRLAHTFKCWSAASVQNVRK